MNISGKYTVHDHKENKTILSNVDIKKLVEEIKIPYKKVSMYANSNNKFSRRYTIERTDAVLDKIIEDLYVTLMVIKNSVSEDRFKRLTFSQKKAGRVS